MTSDSGMTDPFTSSAGTLPVGLIALYAAEPAPPGGSAIATSRPLA